MLVIESIIKKGKSVRDVAGQFSVSPRSLRKWLARYRQGEEAAMHNLGPSTRPPPHAGGTSSRHSGHAPHGMIYLQKKTHRYLVIARPPA